MKRTISIVFRSSVLLSIGSFVFFVSLGTLMALDGSSDNAQDVARPVHFGISLPFPGDNVFIRTGPGSSLKLEKFAPITFEIDTSGRVTGYELGQEADSVYFNQIDSFLLSLEFTPGMIDRKKSDMLLPALARMWPKAEHISFIFPVDKGKFISNMTLYEAGIRLNGVNPAGIIKFPSYFHEFSRGDTMLIYPFLLAKIGLNRTGRPIIIKLIRSTAGVFTDQIMSAINWGNYEPMKRGGVNFASPTYILISLYPELSYPTNLFDASSDNFVSHRESERVRMLIDTLGDIMAPPIPRTTKALTYRSADELGIYSDTISGRIRIDSLGKVHLGLLSNSSSAARSACQEITSHLRFYPALNFQGRPQNFTGLIYFEFDDTSTFVRIRLEWLRIGLDSN